MEEWEDQSHWLLLPPARPGSRHRHACDERTWWLNDLAVGTRPAAGGGVHALGAVSARRQAGNSHRSRPPSDRRAAAHARRAPGRPTAPATGAAPAPVHPPQPHSVDTASTGRPNPQYQVLLSATHLTHSTRCCPPVSHLTPSTRCCPPVSHLTPSSMCCICIRWFKP